MVRNKCISLNFREMNKDPNVYGDDTEAFNPDRYLDPDGFLKGILPDAHEGKSRNALFSDLQRGTL